MFNASTIECMQVLTNYITSVVSGSTFILKTTMLGTFKLRPSLLFEENSAYYRTGLDIATTIYMHLCISIYKLDTTALLHMHLLWRIGTHRGNNRPPWTWQVMDTGNTEQLTNTPLREKNKEKDWEGEKKNYGRKSREMDRQQQYLRLVIF